MADTTKLAGSCLAWRLTVEVGPENLDGAHARCRELGLMPKVCGYNADYRNVVFHVLIPVPKPNDWDGLQTTFKEEMGEYNCRIPHATRTWLIVPPPA